MMQDPEKDPLRSAAAQVAGAAKKAAKQGDDGLPSMLRDVLATSVQTARDRAYGWEFAGQLGLRAARGAADAVVTSVDAVTKGWNKILTLGEVGARGALAMAGLPVSTIPIEMGDDGKLHLGAPTMLSGERGAVEWLTDKADPDALDLLVGSGILEESTAQGAREAQSLKLGPNAEMGAAIAGELASFAIPGTPLAAIGAGSQKIAAAVTGPVAKMAQRLIAQGKLTKDAVDAAMKTGTLVQEVAKASKWTARAVKAAEGAPAYAGEYAALLGQTYAATPESQRPEVMDHMMVGGLVFPALGRIGKAVNERLLDKFLSEADRAALVELRTALQAGAKADVSLARKGSIYMKLLGANGGQTLAETAAFLGMDPKNWDLAISAYNGNPEAMDQLVASFAGTAAGIMLPKMGGVPLHEVPYWKRIRPDVNTYAQQVDAIRQAEMAERVKVNDEAGNAVMAKAVERKAAEEKIAAERSIKEAAERQAYDAAIKNAKTRIEKRKAEEAKEAFEKSIRSAHERMALNAAIQNAKGRIAAGKAAEESARFSEDVTNLNKRIVRRQALDGAIANAKDRIAREKAEKELADFNKSITDFDAEMQRRGRAQGEELGKAEVGRKTREVRDREIRESQEDIGRQLEARAKDDAAVGEMADPMLKSGFTLSMEGVRRGEAVLSHPDGSEILIAPDAVRINRRAYKAMLRRGDAEPVPGEGDVVLTGDAAKEAVSKIALAGAEAQAKGSLYLGGRGMVEMEAGGPWLSTDNGMVYHYGLDGLLYGKKFGAEQWKRVSESSADWLMVEGSPPVADEPAQSAALDAWADFVQQKEANFPERAVDDVLRRALQVARHGGDSDAAVAAREFFESIPPQQVAQAMTPENSQMIAHIIGTLAGGTSNVAEAVRLMDKAVSLEVVPHPDAVKALEKVAETSGEGELTPEQIKKIALTDLYTERRPEERKPVEDKDAVEQPDPESGAIGIDTRPMKDAGKAGLDVGKFLRKVAGRYTTDMVEQIRKQAGEKGKAFAQRVTDFFFAERKGHAEFVPIAKEWHQAAKGKEGRKAQRWLSGEIETSPGVFESRFDILTSGRTLTSKVPARAQKIVDIYHKARVATGEAAERVKTPREVDGKAAWFKVNKDRKIRVWSDLAKDFMDAIASPLVPRSQEAFRKLAEINGIQDVDAFVAKLTEASQSGLGRKSIDREAAAEHVRHLKNIPTSIKLKDGSTFRFREGKPFEAMQSMVPSQIRRNAVMEAFGSDKQDWIKEALGDQRPGLPKVYRDFVKSGGDPDVALRLAERISGIDRSTAWVPKGFLGFLTIRKSLQISKAAVFDIPSPIANIPVFTGYGTVLRALAKVTKNPAEAYREMEMMGAITQHIVATEIAQTMDVVGRAANALSIPLRATQRMSEVIAGMAAKYRLADMKAGKATSVDKLRLDLLNLSEAEKASLMSGQFSKALGERYVQEVVKQSTASKSAAERSYYGSQRLFRELLRYQTFFQTKVQATAKITARPFQELWKASKGQKSDVGAAFMQLGRFVGGAAVGGLLGQYLYQSLRVGWKDAADQMFRDIKQNPLEPVIWAGQTFFGGIGKVLWLMFTDPTISAEKRMAGAIGPVGDAVEALSFATGQGAYQGQTGWNRMMTLAQRAAPVVKDADVLLPLAGMANSEMDEVRSINYRWATEVKKEPRLEVIGGDADSKKMLRLKRAIRDVMNQVGAYTATEILNHPDIKKALGEMLTMESGKTVSQRLLGSRILADRNEDDLKSWRDFAGEEYMRLAVEHDAILTMLASRYEKEKGTPEHSELAYADRLNVARDAARMGDPDPWGKVYADTMTEATESIRAGAPDLRNLQQLAYQMSFWPDRLDRVLTGVPLEMARRTPQRRLAVYLWDVFRTRAVQRYRSDIRAKAKEQVMERAFGTEEQRQEEELRQRFGQR